MNAIVEIFDAIILFALRHNPKILLSFGARWDKDTNEKFKRYGPPNRDMMDDLQ